MKRRLRQRQPRALEGDQARAAGGAETPTSTRTPPAWLSSPMSLGGRLCMAVAALVLALACATGVAAAAMNAHGSVEQVYVTGLDPGAKAVLLDSGGDRVATRHVTSLGAVLFREVKPARASRVQAGGAKSAPLTVMTRRSAPPDTKVYDQKIPTKGYG